MTFNNLTQKQLERLAIDLARQFKAQPVVIGLIGPLGAGKTTFVKAFTQALGSKQAKSPSFVITHQYQAGKRIVYHIDFYRLSIKSQLTPLGLDEILNGKDIVLIEWVDKFPKLKKICDIVITIKVNKNGTRKVTINI